MKGIKKKSVDESTLKEEKIKNETSHVSEYSEEDNNESVGFGNLLQKDVFEENSGDDNEERITNVRKDGRQQRRYDERRENHDQKSKSSRKEEVSIQEESDQKSSKEEKEVTHFKHGIPKEISVFVTAKISTLPYENIDISNGITLTLPPNADHTTATLARAEAYEYCENFIALKVAEIRKALAGAKK